MRLSQNQHSTLSGIRKDNRAASIVAILCGWLVCLSIDLGMWSHAEPSNILRSVHATAAFPTPLSAVTAVGPIDAGEGGSNKLPLSHLARGMLGFSFILFLGCGLAFGGLSAGAVVAGVLAYAFGALRYLLEGGGGLYFDWLPTAVGMGGALLAYGVYMETATRWRLETILGKMPGRSGQRMFGKDAADRVRVGWFAALSELESASDHLYAEWLRLQRLLDSQPWGTIALDMSGRVVTCSEKVEELLGIAPVYGQPLLHSLKHLRSLRESDALVLLEDGIEVQLNERSLWIKKSRIPDDYWLTATVVVMDVTPLRQALDSKMASLRFLSHDLRSPQNSIVSLAELSECAPEEFEACGGIPQIARLAKYTLFISESFIFTSLSDNVQSGQIAKFDLTTMLEDVCEHLRVAANKRQVRLEMIVNEAGGVWVSGVQSFVARAIQNIVDNAIQASRKDQVVGIVLRIAEDDSAEISITDQAGGLPGIRGTVTVSDFASLPLNGTTRGFGLGHQIVAKVVEMHGGELFATSQESVGTMFVMKFPRITGGHQVEESLERFVSA